MSLGEKWIGGLFMIAFATTLILPGRQTPAVIGAFTSLVERPLGTAMGTRKP